MNKKTLEIVQVCDWIWITLFGADKVIHNNSKVLVGGADIPALQTSAHPRKENWVSSTRLPVCVGHVTGSE